MSGPDVGPKSKALVSNWDKKIISTSTNEMDIQFKSDEYIKAIGFSLNIHFTAMPNKECDSWLDMNKKIFQSPNYPQKYRNIIKCSWLITVDHESHITLDIIDFFVRDHTIMTYYYF